VDFKRRSEDGSNRLARIERRRGVLENCLHSPTHSQQFSSRESSNIATFKQDLA
jgi:hypothetical protein